MKSYLVRLGDGRMFATHADTLMDAEEKFFEYMDEIPNIFPKVEEFDPKDCPDLDLDKIIFF
jgi:Asp-tRNA(Asn)/Glu-tRNA(Gln) amidotransferase C subunit